MKKLYQWLTCEIFVVCGLAGVWGLLPDGGVKGGWKRNPPSLCWAGDCGPGPRWWPLRKPAPSTGSSGTGEGGLSSSDCDLRRNTALSSTYFDRNACKQGISVLYV